MHCLRMAAPRARAGVAMCVLCVDESVCLRLRTPCRPATVSAANSTEKMMQFCPLDLHSHLFGCAGGGGSGADRRGAGRGREGGGVGRAAGPGGPAGGASLTAAVGIIHRDCSCRPFHGLQEVRTVTAFRTKETINPALSTYTRSFKRATRVSLTLRLICGYLLRSLLPFLTFLLWNITGRLNV